MATNGDRKTNKLVHKKVGPSGNLVLTRGGRARQHFHRLRRSAAAVQDAGRVREQGARPRTSPPPSSHPRSHRIFTVMCLQCPAHIDHMRARASHCCCCHVAHDATWSTGHKRADRTAGSDGAASKAGGRRCHTACRWSPRCRAATPLHTCGEGGAVVSSCMREEDCHASPYLEDWCSSQLLNAVWLVLRAAFTAPSRLRADS